MFRIDFHRDRISQRANYAVSLRVAHFGGKIKCGLVAASFLCPLQRAGSELRGNGNEYLIPVQPELRGLDRDWQFDFRSIRAERVLQLPLTVFRREYDEILRRLVALASADVRSGGQLGNLHVDTPPASIPRRVRAVVADKVVTGVVVLHALKNFGEVTEVEKRPPSSITRECRQ